MNHQENSYYYVINSWNNLAYGGKDVKRRKGKKGELLVSSVFAMPVLCVHSIRDEMPLFLAPGSVWRWQACLTQSLGLFLWLLGTRLLPCSTIATVCHAGGTVGIMGYCHPFLVACRLSPLPFSALGTAAFPDKRCVRIIRGWWVRVGTGNLESCISLFCLESVET